MLSGGFKRNQRPGGYSEERCKPEFAEAFHGDARELLGVVALLLVLVVFLSDCIAHGSLSKDERLVRPSA